VDKHRHHSTFLGRGGEHRASETGPSSGQEANADVNSSKNTGRESGLFGWLVADGWCWFVLREEYCWLVAAGCW
jgi:hypothetical protein